MPFNTRNPIPSGDLRDLDDNARNIDTWANDKTKFSHPDRFGVSRRTWHGIEQEAKLNIQQAIDAKNAAQDAAMMSGFSKFADTLAQLEAGIGTDYVEGDVVMVFQDESRGDTSSIFKIESGVAVFKNAFDKTRQDLLSFTGTVSADAEWSDVPAHSDPAFDVQAQALANRTEFINKELTNPSGDEALGGFASYADLQTYDGDATHSRLVEPTGVIDPGISGDIYRVDGDTTSTPDGGTSWRDGLGRLWRRVYSGTPQARWWGVKSVMGHDDTAALQAAQNSGHAVISLPAGKTTLITDTIEWKADIVSDGDAQTTIAIDSATPKIMLHGKCQLTGVRLKDVQYNRRIHTGTSNLFPPNPDPRFSGSYRKWFEGCTFEDLAVGMDHAGVYLHVIDGVFQRCDIGFYPRGLSPYVDGEHSSTMFFFDRTHFFYCNYGFKHERRFPGLARASQRLINVKFSECGFEQNSYGIYADGTDLWDGVLVNCWFEANSSYGLYSPWGGFTEIGCRHEVNSPVLYASRSEVGGSQSIRLKYGALSTKDGYFRTIRRLTDDAAALDYLEIPESIYSVQSVQGSHNSYVAGRYLGQGFTSEAGAAIARVHFWASPSPAGGGQRNATEIRFSTTRSSNAVDTDFGIKDRLRITANGNLEPMTDQDAKLNLGKADARWNNSYFAVAPTVSSDVSTKEQIRDLSEAERAVALRIKGLLKAYKLKSSVAEKGENARWHFGVIAQEVKSSFEAEGLNADEYGLFCYDEWGDQYAPVIATRKVLQDDGTEIEEKYATNEQVLVQTAGSLMGIRYEELYAFLIAAL